VIDPGLDYSTFLEGTRVDIGESIAVRDGRAYVTGKPPSPTYPPPKAPSTPPYGVLVATIGLIALGAFTRVAGVLPWWCAVALIVGSPLSLVLEWVLVRMLLGTLWPIEPNMEPNRPISWDIIETISWAVFAVPWIVVGFAVFRAAGRRTEQPSTVR
jgi:apolipoprotein N-acyltransferase